MTSSIVLLLQNFYIYFEPYAKLLSFLREKGRNASLLYLEASPEMRKAKRSLASSVAQKVRGIDIDRHTVLGKCLMLPALLLNRHWMKKYLLQEQPAVVVVGVDVADAYARIFIDLCHAQKIPVMIFALVQSGSGIRNLDPEKGIPFSRIFRRVLRLFHLEKAIYFRDWVIGSYSPTSQILVVSKAMQEELISYGVMSDRISVVGNPLSDELLQLKSHSHETVRLEMCQELKYPSDTKYIVYVTEVIQNVHGSDYLKKLNELLYDAFEQLPAHYKVIVKLHPRENEVSILAYEHIFQNERYCVIQKTHLLRLLKSAELVLGHYSAVLFDAALLGTPTVTLHFAKDGRSQFQNIDPETCIQSKQDMIKKLNEVVTDPLFGERNRQCYAHWFDQYGPPQDGKPMERFLRQLEVVNNRVPGL